MFCKKLKKINVKNNSGNENFFFQRKKFMIIFMKNKEKIILVLFFHFKMFLAEENHIEEALKTLSFGKIREKIHFSFMWKEKKNMWKYQ